MSGELEELEAWYEAQCDGEWEHDFGLDIGTLDNPGWMVDIPLTGTSLEERAFRPIEELASERMWMVCEVSDGAFRGRGGAPMLGRMLRVFLDGAREASGEAAAPAP
jgi:hypothetical protein